jgi:hypothetical protein
MTAKAKGYMVLTEDNTIDPDLYSQLKLAGIIDLRSMKAFHTATRKEYKHTTDKLKKKDKNPEKEKEKRKAYYEREDIKQKRKEYNERPEVKERKKKLQSKRSNLLKTLREKEPELYAKYYLSGLEEIHPDDHTDENNDENKENVDPNVNKSDS